LAGFAENGQDVLGDGKLYRFGKWVIGVFATPYLLAVYEYDVVASAAPAFGTDHHPDFRAVIERV